MASGIVAPFVCSTDRVFDSASLSVSRREHLVTRFLSPRFLLTRRQGHGLFSKLPMNR